MIINWNYPAPRSGLSGMIDKFIGPGALRAEVMLQMIFPIVAAIIAPLYAWRVVVSWSAIQYIMCIVLAFDITGGIVTNSTSSAKRWYHRAGQGVKQHLAFVSVHLVHLLIVAWLYLTFDIWWLFDASACLLVSAVTVLLVPLYLQRPVALIAYTCVLLISLYGLQQPVGLDWFLPLLYLKLVVSYLPKEEPYRPGDGS